MNVNKFTRKQRLSVICAEARVNVWEGAVRSSKTICSIMRWLRFIKSAPKGNLLMVGKTERTLKRNIIDVIIEMVGKKRAKYISGRGEFIVFGRTIYVAGANDEAAQEKIRGLTLVGAYGDEISIWPESFFTMLLSRLSVAGSKFFGTTNPDNPVHWLKKLLDRVAVHLTRDGDIVTREIGSPTRKGKVLNWARMTFKLRDNPNLPEEYLRSLESEYSGLWYKRFILGEWVAAEGAVFDFWDPDLYVVDKLPPMRRIVSDAIDYGTTNPTAGTRMGLGVDNVLYIMGEFAPPAGVDASYSKGYASWSLLRGEGAPDYVFVDPAAASLKLQMRTDKVHPRIRNGNNDVLDGIRLMTSLMKSGRLKIHSSCENLLEELPGYVWDPEYSKKGEDKVIKQNDHWIDSLRYNVKTGITVVRPFLQLPIRELEVA